MQMQARLLNDNLKNLVLYCFWRSHITQAGSQNDWRSQYHFKKHKTKKKASLIRCHSFRMNYILGGGEDKQIIIKKTKHPHLIF